MIATPSGRLLSFGDGADAELPNEVSERALSLADGVRNIREIAEVICAEFDVDRPTAEGDLISFFKTLTDAGAFEIRS